MEHEGAYLAALDQALAARNNRGIIISQVKRLTAFGTLRPQQVRVPGVLVDYVVIDPDQQQTTQTVYNPAISGEVFRPLWDFKPIEWGVDKIIARRAALGVMRRKTSLTLALAFAHWFQGYCWRKDCMAK